MDKKSSAPQRTDEPRSQDQKELNASAEKQAEKDIANDPEASAHSPNDDLDEGELARLGENNNPVE